MTLHLGIIGAGNFTRRRLLPNFLKLPDVEVVAVCNRSLASSQKVASEFNIPHALAGWQELLARPDIDAVLIGTQPYFHHQAAIAAFDAGKHVLCQTRMATSLREAREMLQRVEETGCRAMLVRSSLCLRDGRYLKHLIDSGYTGKVRQVFACGRVPNYIDSRAPLHRRQDSRLYGAINPLSLGIHWDAMRYWFGEASRVFAHGRVFTPARQDGDGGPIISVDMPDCVTAIVVMESGVEITCVQSGVTRFGESRVEIYGEQGTLVYDAAKDELLGARVGESCLAPLPVPEEFAEGWHVEADFVRLVRGEIDEAYPSFYDGVKNVEFLEACDISSAEGRWVDLPLA